MIFQADIRRALTRVGRGLFTSAPRQEAHAIEEVVRASQALAQRRVGALVVIERDVGLDEYMDLGTPIDAELTRDLLVALFLPYSPLHDGAVVIREGRIASAGCILPLALRSNLPSTLGTRHRAALGDEPTGALNSAAGATVLQSFRDINAKGQTVLMATHEVHAACCGDRVVYLRDGELIAELQLDREMTIDDREPQLLSWLSELGW